ncbi:hypothetical protein MKX01_000915 [Papaver californicum]|nr:hypothetical protein MKX01_000915 [Papaver californicum]
MDVHRFVAAAHSYWVSELTCLGRNVLEKLNSLYGFCVGKSFSMFNQGTTSLHIFEATKGLMEPKVLDWEAPKTLLEYSASSKQRFFEIISMTKLRKTELCREITKEGIMEIIISERKLSLGRIWKVVMLIFVSGSLPAEMCRVIVNRSDLSPHWKFFFEQFKDCIDSRVVRSSFLLQIKNSLGKTFHPNLRKISSYMSPFHFSYLLERFLYLASSWKSIFFTTKSSLLETLTCEGWKLSSKSELETDIRLKEELRVLEGFLLGFGHDILTRYSLEWLKILYHAENHFDLLCDILIKDDISSLLSMEFGNILALATPAKYSFRGVSNKVDYNRLSKLFAKVLKIIENPLVILYIGNNRPTFSCVDAIFIDMELILCREDILNILYPERTKCVQQDAVELETEYVNAPSCIIESIIHCSQRSTSFIEEEHFVENEHEHVSDLQGGYKTVWRAYGSSAMDPFALKFNVQLLIRVLDAATAKLNLNASSGAEDRSFATETEIMLAELKQLLIALRKRISTHPFKICSTYKKLANNGDKIKATVSSFFRDAYGSKQCY